MFDDVLFLLENSMFDDKTERDAILADKTALATNFVYSFLGVLALYNNASNKAKFKQYFRSDSKLQFKAISDDNNDTSLIVRLVAEAGLFKNRQVVNEITRFLFKMKSGEIDQIDPEILRGWMNQLKPEFFQALPAKLKAPVKAFITAGPIADLALELRKQKRQHKVGSEYLALSKLKQTIDKDGDNQKDSDQPTPEAKDDVQAAFDAATAIMKGMSDGNTLSPEQQAIADAAKKAQEEAEARAVAELEAQRATKFEKVAAVGKITDDMDFLHFYNTIYASGGNLLASIYNTDKLGAPANLNFKDWLVWVNTLDAQGLINAVVGSLPLSKQLVASAVIAHLRGEEEDFFNVDIAGLQEILSMIGDDNVTDEMRPLLRKVIQSLYSPNMAQKAEGGLFEHSEELFESLFEQIFLDVSKYDGPSGKLERFIDIKHTRINRNFTAEVKKKLFPQSLQDTMGNMIHGKNAIWLAHEDSVKSEPFDKLLSSAREGNRRHDFGFTWGMEALMMVRGFDQSEMDQYIDYCFDNKIHFLHEQSMFFGDSLRRHEAVKNFTDGVEGFGDRATSKFSIKSLAKFIMGGTASIASRYISYMAPKKTVKDFKADKSMNSSYLLGLSRLLPMLNDENIWGIIETALRNRFESEIANYKSEDIAYDGDFLGIPNQDIGAIGIMVENVRGTRLPKKYNPDRILGELLAAKFLSEKPSPDMLDITNVFRSYVAPYIRLEKLSPEDLDWYVNFIGSSGGEFSRSRQGKVNRGQTRKRDYIHQALYSSLRAIEDEQEFIKVVTQSPSVRRTIIENASPYGQGAILSRINEVTSEEGQEFVSELVEYKLSQHKADEYEPENLIYAKQEVQDLMSRGLFETFANREHRKLLGMVSDNPFFQYMHPDNINNRGNFADAKTKKLAVDLLARCVVSGIDDDPDYIDTFMDNVKSTTFDKKVRAIAAGRKALTETINAGPVSPFGKVTEQRLVQLLKYNDIDIESLTATLGIRKKKGEKVSEFINRIKGVAEDKDLISPIAVEEVQTSLREKSEIAARWTNNFHAGKHGNIYPRVDKVFDVTLPREKFEELRDSFAEEGYNGTVVPAFHATGGIAANFILRYGFKTLKSGDSSTVGRMLGDGVYFTNKIDKAMLYASNEGYVRHHGSQGYVFEMETTLGKQYRDYDSAGLGGDGIRSPEWCVYDPERQLQIVRCYQVSVIGYDQYRSQVLGKLNEDEGMKTMGQVITEAEEAANAPKNLTSFLFYNGDIPVVGKNEDGELDIVDHVDFEKFDVNTLPDGAYLDIGFYGPSIVFEDTDENQSFEVEYQVTTSYKQTQKFLELWQAAKSTK